MAVMKFFQSHWFLIRTEQNAGHLYWEYLSNLVSKGLRAERFLLHTLGSQ